VADWSYSARSAAAGSIRSARQAAAPTPSIAAQSQNGKPAPDFVNSVQFAGAPPRGEYVEAEGETLREVIE
jgi:hypothetical protein